MKRLFVFTFFLLLSVPLTMIYSQSPVLMNEIFSRGADADPDWIELYNSSDAEINISSYRIYDSGAKGGTKDKKRFPSGAVIPAKGFYVIVTDGSEASDFGLSNNGEGVWLEDGSGAIIDSLSFPPLAASETFARIPDGSPNWKKVTDYTKGTTNGWGSISVVMNEIFSRGTAADPDWIELYNISSNDVDLSGYKIYDSGAQGGTKDKKGFPSGAVIPAKGFYVIVTDGSEPNDFGLSNNGEEVWFEDGTGAVIDNVIFPALESGKTYARIPDGSTTWRVVTDYTKGKSNIVKSPIVMNEIYSRGTATEPDWIELYNDSNSQIDLSGFKIYDSGANGGTKDKKGFPSGAYIPVKGFYVILTDGSEASDFGLSNSGEEVWLEDGTGAVIDNVIFPALVLGETYARIPDGSSAWKIVTDYTKGSSNGTGTSVGRFNELITDYRLGQNYPNPFNPTTVISYQLAAGSHVELKIYDMLGSEISTLVDEFKPTGNYTLEFNSQTRGLSSGIYFYTLKAGDYTHTKKMLLLK